MEKIQLKKERDYLFDNYKVILIFLVVVGHFIEPAYGNNSLINAIKWIIVSFHMPAFIFISGYFSKREIPVSVSIRKLAVPYLVYEVIYYLFYTFIIQKETGLYLTRPKFSLWYLLALFVWRVITPYIKKIPHHFLLSVVAGLFIGLSDIPGNFLSIPRILVFYPFFLAGMYFDRQIITKFRNIKTQRIAGIITACTLILVAIGPFTRMYSTKIFYGRYNYDSLGQTSFEGILCRIVCYAISFVLTYALMFLITEKETSYSYIGPRTMAVYLFHGLTYNFVKDCTDILENVNTLEETALLLAACAALTKIFAARPLVTFTNKISDLHFSDIGLYIPQDVFIPRLGYV